MVVTLPCRYGALVVLALALPTQIRAQINEGFNNVATLTDWLQINNSTAPVGTGWFQGDRFPANSGPPNSYIAANFENTAASGTISNWLLTPVVSLVNGAQFSFFTRTFVGDELFPDRLELRLSTSGGSVDVGLTPESVGDFTTLLRSINPELGEDYPGSWTQFIVTVGGVSELATGRFGFRYFVTESGPEGVNGDYIGIDDVVYAVSVPEPGSALLLGSGLIALLALRARKRYR